MDVEVAQIVGVLGTRNDADVVTQLLLLQELLREILREVIARQTMQRRMRLWCNSANKREDDVAYLEISLRERVFRAHVDVALLSRDGDNVTQDTSLAVHLDALLQEVLLQREYDINCELPA